MCVSFSDSGRFVLGHEQIPPQAARRHQFDGTFRFPKLRSVEKTAAANENALVQADDATSVSMGSGQVREVCHTAVS